MSNSMSAPPEDNACSLHPRAAAPPPPPAPPSAAAEALVRSGIRTEHSGPGTRVDGAMWSAGANGGGRGSERSAPPAPSSSGLHVVLRRRGAAEPRRRETVRLTPWTTDPSPCSTPCTTLPSPDSTPWSALSRECREREERRRERERERQVWGAKGSNPAWATHAVHRVSSAPPHLRRHLRVSPTYLRTPRAHRRRRVAPAWTPGRRWRRAPARGARAEIARRSRGDCAGMRGDRTFPRKALGVATARVRKTEASRSALLRWESRPLEEYELS